MRYALIDGSGAVVNVIELEEGADYQAEPGLTLAVMTEALDANWRQQRPGPPPIPPGPVTAITKRQMLLWLLANKQKTESDVLAAIGTISDPTVKAEAEIAFKYPDGNIMHRDSPLFDQLGPLFQMTPAEIDAAFAAAGAL